MRQNSSLKNVVYILLHTRSTQNTLKAEPGTDFSLVFYLVHDRGSRMAKLAKTIESGNNNQAPAPLSHRNLSMRNAEQGSALLLCHWNVLGPAVGRLREGKGEIGLNFSQSIYPLIANLLRGKLIRHQQKDSWCPHDSMG